MASDEKEKGKALGKEFFTKGKVTKIKREKGMNYYVQKNGDVFKIPYFKKKEFATKIAEKVINYPPNSLVAIDGDGIFRFGLIGGRKKKKK